jgi:hypothetical protein
MKNDAPRRPRIEPTHITLFLPATADEGGVVCHVASVKAPRAAALGVR